jgi:hypothetical protein
MLGPLLQHFIKVYPPALGAYGPLIYRKQHKKDVLEPLTLLCVIYFDLPKARILELLGWNSFDILRENAIQLYQFL